VELQTSLLRMWAQGDGVHRLIAVILLVFSLVSWVVLVLKAWEHWQFSRATRALQHAASTQALWPVVARSHYYRDLVSALEAPSPAVEVNGAARLDQALDGLAHHASWGMVWLGVVGSSAPFVGLLGTVWGIYHALLSMGAHQVARVDQVAGPIGEALVMTALGLAVAIPATVGYNLLVRANKSKQFYAMRLGRRLLQSSDASA
jgi:biopolymer transport protein ExbB